LQEAEANTEALEESLAGSKVADLTELVTKGGKMKGHLTGVTPKQYRKFLGKEAPPDLLKKARDATTRKISWDLALDQLASERGYKSDEELRDAIEQAHDAKKGIEEGKARQKLLRNEIFDLMRQDPSVEKVVLDDVCPQFPESTCTAEVTLVNGMEFRLRRQHSYWRIDAGDKSFRNRYAKDARALAAVATKQYKADIREAKAGKLQREKQGMRLTRKSPRITPLRPTLRR